MRCAKARAAIPLTVAAGLLAACGSPAVSVVSAGSQESCHVLVLVVSGRMNSPAPQLTPSMAAAARRAIDQGDPIGLVSLDGTPRLSRMAAFSDPGVNHAALEQARQNFLATLTAAVARTRATSPHADVLDALDVASRAVRGDCSRGGTIYLEDSGLQETGPLDFRQPGTLGAQPGDIVRFLRAQHELPDLSGMRLVLAGIGDTAAPQQPLSIAQRANLTAIWTAIVRAGGGTVQVSQTPRIGIPAPRHVPQVSLVPVPAEPQWSQNDPSYRFPDSGPVGFEPNVAVLRDRAAAVAALRPIAQFLIADRGAVVELTGTTAHWGTLVSCIGLSRARAEAVKAILVRLGAGPVQIITRGVGWRFAGYRNDQGPGGILLPGPAEHNRSVIVTQYQPRSR